MLTPIVWCCRKKKAVHKTTSTDDKRLQSTLKRLGVNTIPGIEEVLLINNDGSALQFTNPKVQASIAANTYVVSGPSTNKSELECASWGALGPWAQYFATEKHTCSVTAAATLCLPRLTFSLPCLNLPAAESSEVLSSMMSGLGGMNMNNMMQMMQGMGGMPSFNPEGAADEPDDDDGEWHIRVCDS
jgi:NACalpha-BTF3-like transcription factor